MTLEALTGDAIRHAKTALIRQTGDGKEPVLMCNEHKLHGPTIVAVKAKFYGVLYNRSSSIAFDETSSYWSAPKSS